MVTRPPAPLLALLGTVLVLGWTWALVTPPLHAPDEPEHFSYVQTIGELGRLPGGAGKPFSTELSRAADVTDLSHVVYSVHAKPEWSRLVADAFPAGAGPADDGGGVNNASTYPPLYYAVEALPYAVAEGAGVFTRLSLARMASSLWLLVTVTAAWLLAGELFGRRRLPQLVAAGTAGLWPLMTFVSASVNPDALLIALWTLALWLGVKVLKRGLTPGRGLALGAVAGAALVTKASALVLVPPVLAAVALAAWWGRDAGRGRAAVACALAVGAAALPFAVWTAARTSEGRSPYGQASEISANAGSERFNVREFASYLWQFYLPPLSSMKPVQHQFPVISQRPAVNVWLGSGSAVFGWVNVWFPKGVYWAIGVALALVAVLFAAASARWWRAAPRGGRLRRLVPAGFLVAVGLVTLAALHYTDYSFYAAQKGLFMQGRYLLPLAGLLAAAVGWALLALPRRWQGAAAGIWLGALVVLQVASLGLVLGRWYA